MSVLPWCSSPVAPSSLVAPQPLVMSAASITYSAPLVVNSSGTLNITGGNTTAPTPTAVTVAGGGTLSLANTVGPTFALGGGTLNLGAGSGTATLGFDLGSSTTPNYDSITSTAAATTANTV